MRRGGRAHTALAGTGMVKWDTVRGAGPTQRGGARHLNHKRIFFPSNARMALARSFIKPERQLHFANSPN